MVEQIIQLQSQSKTQIVINLMKQFLKNTEMTW